MNISTLSARDWAIIAAVGTLVVGLIIAAIAGWLSYAPSLELNVESAVAKDCARSLAALNMTVL